MMHVAFAFAALIGFYDAGASFEVTQCTIRTVQTNPVTIQSYEYFSQPTPSEHNPHHLRVSSAM